MTRQILLTQSKVAIVMEREIDFDKTLIMNAREHVHKARNPGKKSV